MRVGNASPAILRTYYFDPGSLTLTLVDAVSAVGATTVGESPNNEYLADADWDNIERAEDQYSLAVSF